MNRANLAVYGHPRIAELLRTLAAQDQLGTRDLDLAMPFLRNAERVLEVGPGAGRVLDALLDRLPHAALTGLEYSPTLVRYLRQRYQRRVQIIHADALAAALPETYDAVLMLWSLLNDFAPAEQVALVQRAAGWLRHSGHLVIDLPRAGARRYATAQPADQTATLQTALGPLTGYDPGDQDILDYADSAGLRQVFRAEYLTPGRRERVIYVLGQQMVSP